MRLRMATTVAPLGRTVLHVATLLSLFSLAYGCSLPKGSCKPQFCGYLWEGMGPKSGNHEYSWPIGFYQGIWNDVTWNKTTKMNVPGGPFVNLEVFREIGTLVGTSPAATLKDCCNACAQTSGCLMYHYFPTSSKPWTKAMPGWVTGIKCYLISGGSEIPRKEDNSPAPNGVPASGTHSDQLGVASYYDMSFVGGLCSPGVSDDPHFVGARGTRFDFNGQINRAFCLVTDSHLHINAVMGGYEAETTSSANSALSTLPTNASAAAASKKLRTWIQEVGITWVAEDGSKHFLHLTARKGDEQKRGAGGFLSHMVVDGKEVAAPSRVGEGIKAGDSLAAGLSFTLVEQGRKGGAFDMDTYSLVIPGLADMTMRMRVAHPLLQKPNEAFAHFNLHFDDLKITPKVHGVLGQTFRQTAEQAKRAMDYSMLTKLLGGAVVADGETGKGFLDGTAEDYVSSGPLATDCTYSTFDA